MKRKGVLLGRHYTPEERTEAVEFARKFNETHGRGGPSAAARKFGMTSVAVSQWMGVGLSESTAKMGPKLKRLEALVRKMKVKEQELAEIHAEYEALKAKL